MACQYHTDISTFIIILLTVQSATAAERKQLLLNTTDSYTMPSFLCWLEPLPIMVKSVPSKMLSMCWQATPQEAVKQNSSFIHACEESFSQNQNDLWHKTKTMNPNLSTSLLENWILERSLWIYKTHKLSWKHWPILGTNHKPGLLKQCLQPCCYWWFCTLVYFLQCQSFHFHAPL